MATELTMDPRGYAGSYSLIGGRLCLDFANTLAWAGTQKEHDWFEPWSNILTWCLATDLIAQETAESLTRKYRSKPDEAARALDVIKGQRSILSRAVSPLAKGGRPTPGALRDLNALLADALPGRRIDPNTLAWTWSPVTRLEDITAPIALDAADLIATADHTRLGSCPACEWLFYDTSRNRSRQWCEMATCGSRHKALRYYHRQAKGG